VTRTLCLGMACVVLIAAGACGPGDEEEAPPQGRQGGTLTFLYASEKFSQLDPQRVYDSGVFGFAISFLHRSLVMVDPYAESDAGLLPDLATDTGRPNSDATEWEFTLRDDATWEDGSAVTCEHVAYGVSRTFAQDVITDGPVYAIDLLDIPTLDDGSSAYRGPYTGEGQEHFDRAVSCDGNTITFVLNRSVGDFNYAASLPAFGPVKPEADSGEAYSDAPLSSGPYRIEQYDAGDRIVLVRNENWLPESDPYRPAYPDQVVGQFSVDPQVADERLIQSEGDDRYALGNAVLPPNLERVFNDPTLADRRWDVLDTGVFYIAVNTALVPVLEHRLALMAALDREAILTALGGEFAGDEADGVVKPTLERDYTPTQLWSGLLGRDIPATGYPQLARELIEDSGEPMPDLVYDYPAGQEKEPEVSAFIEAMRRAGISVTANPIPAAQYYGTVLRPDTQNHLTWAGWGPDWANASTVIPPLFGVNGGFNLSRINEGGLEDARFQDAIDAAGRETDRNAQAQMWQDLNTRVVELGLVIPTVFSRGQALWGSGLGGVQYSPSWGGAVHKDIYIAEDGE
jgi:peptide/nickel transport system substrate-binding protein